MIQILIVFVLVLAAGLAVAVAYLPWWGTAFVIAGLLVVGQLMSGYIRALVLTVLKRKGEVLSGATVQVHRVEPVDPPRDQDESAEEDPEPRDFFDIDVTILPLAASGRYRCWETGELRLVPLDAPTPGWRGRVSPGVDDGRIHNVLVYGHGSFQPDDHGRHEGPRRLRLLVAVHRDSPRRLGFRYYFQTFGHVLLPEPARAPATAMA